MRRQDDIFRKCTQGLCVHYVFTEVKELLPAVLTGETGCAVDSHYLIAFFESFHPFSDFCDDTGKFMSENSGHRK